MPRSFTFATITEYKAAKGNSGAIYAELVSSGIKSGSCVSKITATGDVFIDSINPFVTPELGQEGDTLYYSSTEGYRFLRAGNTAWDADSYGQVYIDLAKIPSGFSKVEPFVDEFVYKRTTEDIGSGKASMTKILGNSVAWNQLVNPSDFTGSGSVSGVSVVINGPVITLNDSATSYFNLVIFKENATPYTIAGHKYLLSVKTTSNAIIVQDTDNGASLKVSKSTPRIIYTATTTATFRSAIRIRAAQGSVFNNDTVEFNIVDLTLLYGSEIDGLTDAQILAKFESEFPGYHSYNAGTLISNKAKAIEFVGFNQWDEEWVNGYYNSDGSINDGDSSALRSKNLITVSPGTTYYWHTPYGGRIYFFGADGSFIERTNTIGDGATFTTPVNCYKIGFNIFTGASGYVYGNDICINLSDASKNGTYEPYKKVVLPLPNLDQIKVYSHNIWDETFQATNKYIADDGTFSDSDVYNISSYIKVEPNTIYYLNNVVGPNAGLPAACWYDENKQYITGLAGASNIYNKTITSPSNARYLVCSIYKPTIGSCCINLSSSFNGQYEPHGILTIEGGLKSAGSVRDEIVGNKFVKKVGRVDFGALTWTYMSASIDLRWRSNWPDGIKASSDASTAINAIHSNLEVVPINVQNSDTTKNNIAAYLGLITARNGSSTVTPSGYLDYELATPIEYEIYSPLKMPYNWKYRVSEYHTKKMLPENGENPTSAPFACEIKQI